MFCFRDHLRLTFCVLRFLLLWFNSFSHFKREYTSGYWSRIKMCFKQRLYGRTNMGAKSRRFVFCFCFWNALLGIFAEHLPVQMTLCFPASYFCCVIIFLPIFFSMKPFWSLICFFVLAILRNKKHISFLWQQGQKYFNKLEMLAAFIILALFYWSCGTKYSNE